MSNPEQINLSEKAGGEPLKDALSVITAIHQLLQGMARIEQRLSAIESRLAGVKGAKEEKPKIRPILIAQLMKGWMSDVEIMEKAGWQMEGVRSFITKLRGMGFSVEYDRTRREGVVYYRIAK